MEEEKPYIKLLDNIYDDIRVLEVVLEDKYHIGGKWKYKIIFYENDEICEDYVLGKDITEALYLFGQSKRRQFYPNYLKKFE